MEARETSGATTGLVVRHVRQHGGEAAVAAMLRLAGVSHTPDELEDESRWVSYRTRVALFEAAVEVLGDPEAPRVMGATSLQSGLNPSLVLLLRALGSPRQVYRQLPRAVPKFSTTSTMQVLSCTDTTAVLRYRLHDGHRHSRLDCDYAQGLIATVPQIFGLPPACVRHDECESDGAPACIYRLEWARRPPLHRRLTGPRSPRVDAELVALRAQLERLQSAAADLTASDDPASMLDRITERAAAAVLAPAYLLVVDDPGGGPPVVRSRGLEPAHADALAPRLLSGEDLGPDAVVVDVTSGRRRHGRLAALYREGHPGPAAERALLAAYAGHAAAALDLHGALERSRRGEQRAEALLALAHDLRLATDTRAVGEVVVRALPRVVGCRSAGVLAWDPQLGALRPLAVAGLPEAEQAVFLDQVFPVAQIPEVADLLTRQEPTLIDEPTATPVLRELLAAIRVEDVVVVPLLAGDELLGVITASWGAGRRPGDVAELLHRLRGVGEHAATALENSRLLATVRRQALHDALTGLPNRVLFARELDAALAAAGPDDTTAVLFCDLDRFKHVNDTLGHAAGDELLRQVAVRLRSALRPHDVVARLSGDEFAVLLRGVADLAAGEALGQRVVECYAEPFRLEGRELRVTTSVGVALRRGGAGQADLLLRAADGAMYTAKRGGRNQVACAPVAAAGAPAPGPTATARPALDEPSLECELQAAVAAGELRLAVQPLARLVPDGLRLVGGEALLRWQHPRLGLLPPAAFLPLAERLGLLAELDLWAVREACRQRGGWAGGPDGPLHVAVNVAASTLLDPRLPGAVRGALGGAGLAPDRLHLEVVESRALADLPGLVERLSELRQLGIRVALDDFGTGFSSLAWLQRLPVDQLKIDRSFTAALPGHPPSLAIVRGVVALARSLEVEVVAEGVESEEQLAALARLGCRVVQGYLIGRPVPGPPRLPGAVEEQTAGLLVSSIGQVTDE